MAEAWTNADEASRRKITAAANQVDVILSSSPSDEGESRPGGSRILFVAPLAMYFEIDEQARMVTVLRAWAFGKRK